MSSLTTLNFCIKGLFFRDMRSALPAGKTLARSVRKALPGEGECLPHN